MRFRHRSSRDWVNVDTNLAREGLGFGLGTSHVALDLGQLRVTRLSVWSYTSERAEVHTPSWI